MLDFLRILSRGMDLGLVMIGFGTALGLGLGLRAKVIDSYFEPSDLS